ncbi:hypothetical protein DY000_02056633 [Brassica cretica]|uniref:40S ribosomal protein S19-binding protein 1 n=1 Tax=Brassica cretica TaxID=69181 RepID=A0ABQ7AIY5_BRACR|nr:hypothetical protein DY000_02056633 [Brassica cretica]
MAIRWRFSPSLWLLSTERRELYWCSSATKENCDLSIGGSSRPWETARNVGLIKRNDSAGLIKKLSERDCVSVGVLLKTHHTCSSHKGPTIHHRESSQATENKRTPGVKAAKKACQKTVVSDGDLKKFQSMWTMRQADLDRKERLSQLSLLNSLIGKKEPLPKYKETLKKKPINDLCSVSCSKLMFLFNVLVSEMML